MSGRKIHRLFTLRSVRLSPSHSEVIGHAQAIYTEMRSAESKPLRGNRTRTKNDKLLKVALQGCALNVLFATGTCT